MRPQTFHPKIVKRINRFLSRNDTDLVTIALDIGIPPEKFYNMVEGRVRWTPDALIRLYRHMKAMRDRLIAKQLLQAIFDDDEISIPNTGDVIKDKLLSLMQQTLNAMDKNELNESAARRIASEAERFGATVKQKAREG